MRNQVAQASIDRYIVGLNDAMRSTTHLFWSRYFPMPVSQPITPDMQQMVDDLVRHGGMREPSHVLKVDSAEGIAMLVEWARKNHIVLGQEHKRIADKYKVSTEGVIISGRIPT